MTNLNSLLHPWKKRAGRSVAWLAVIGMALAFGLTLLDSVSGSETPAVAARGTAVQGGPAPALALMFTGEVMGWTEPCG